MIKLYLLLLFCVVLFRSSGQAGSLDHTFGNNGVQTTAFFSNVNILDEEGRVVLTNAKGDIFLLVQSGDSARIGKFLADGRLDASYSNAGYSNALNLHLNSAVMQGDKIIVAGSNSSDFALARYTADGSLDSSFGENGIVTTDFNNSGDAAYSIALQEDKIVVAGSTYNYEDYESDFALARYTADGVLDTSFGKNGKVTTDFSFEDNYANSIAIKGDMIIVGGYTSYFGDNSYISLARYTANGRLKATVTTETNYNHAFSMVLQGDRIILGGYAVNDKGNINFSLIRYTAALKLDSTFGKNGIVTTINGEAYSIALQGDKIIAAGTTGHYTGDFAIARYTADGKLDATFGKNGKITTDFNGYEDRVNSIAIQGDKIIAAGYAYQGTTNNDYALARYTADGRLDASFGKGGKLTDGFPASQAFFTSTVIQGDKIIAAGYAFNANNNTDFALARFTADGKLDLSFGENGKVTTDFRSASDYANAIALQGDKIVVGGYTYRYPDNLINYKIFALARYTADGRLDSSFGVNGIVTTDFNSNDAAINSITLQGDKIVVAGYTGDDIFDNTDFALARYTADGKLDASFGKNGKVITDLKTGIYDNEDRASSIALQGNKLLVGGSTRNDENYTTDFALIRYTADGRLDASFGESGIARTDFGDFSNDHASSIALQGDKILMAGSAGYYGDFALARYTADGKLDASFGNQGKVITDLGSYTEEAKSIALQGDKIVLGGYSDKDYTYRNFAFARYTADGKLDATFGKNGKVITDFGGSASFGDIALHQNRLYAVGSLTVNASNTYGLVAAYRLEASEPSISIADVTVSESKKLAIVTVRLSAPASKIVRVHFTTRNKTAVGNQDYIPISGPLLFIPNVNTTAKIIIPIVDDSQDEGNEQFEIVLTNARNAIIQDSVGVVTIIDDDAAPIAKQGTSLHIQASPNPSASTFTVQLQGSNLKQPIRVRVYDVGGRLIEEKQNISIGQSLRLGDQYKAGAYIIEAVQGSQSVQTKVIKTGK